MTDSDAMRRAIALSKKGFPAPNPHVGCVLTKGDVIVGEGFHAFAGGPHAEIVALGRAGTAARGATAYVTLEPCNHHGRTGPCARALIEAGVRRVVVAVPDPNPRAAGGMETLRLAGVETQVGQLAKAAAEANFRFLFAMREKRPHVTVKAAFSLDGRIALPNGESQWITGQESRRRGHRLRAECGGVLVGRRTVARDDPELTARISQFRGTTVPIVLDPRGALGGEERVLQRTETIWVKPGHPAVEGGDVSLPRLLADLYERGLTSLLVEGGGITIGHFVRADLVDRYELFIAAKLLGEGPSWVSASLGTQLPDLPRLHILAKRASGSDIQISAVPERRSPGAKAPQSDE